MLRLMRPLLVLLAGLLLLCGYFILPNFKGHQSTKKSEMHHLSNKLDFTVATLTEVLDKTRLTMQEIKRLEREMNQSRVLKEIKYLREELAHLNDMIVDKPKQISQTLDGSHILNDKTKDSNTPNIKLVNSKDVGAMNVQVIILVTSHIGHRNRRDSMRTNWGDSSKFAKHLKQNYNEKATYKIYFMTGYLQSEIEKAKNESTLHKDMLITNRTEDYWDFSRRVMFGFLWSLENCKYEYLFKADDDVFVNIPNLFNLLYKDPFVLKHKDRLYAGNMFTNYVPHRSKDSKWYVSREEWAPVRYPPFTTGMAIILSRLVIEKMVPYFNWVKPFRLDDVYVGMLVKHANVPGLGIRKPKWKEFYDDPHCKKCNFHAVTIVQHSIINDTCVASLTKKSIA